MIGSSLRGNEQFVQNAKLYLYLDALCKPGHHPLAVRFGILPVPGLRLIFLFGKGPPPPPPPWWTVNYPPPPSFCDNSLNLLTPHPRRK